MKVRHGKPNTIISVKKQKKQILQEEHGITPMIKEDYVQQK